MIKFELSLAAPLVVVSAVLSATPQASAQSHEHHHAAPSTQPEASQPSKPRMKVQLGSSAAFDASGTLWLVSRDPDSANGELVLQKSNDNGGTWSDRVRISSETAIASGDERPRIAFGHSGELFVTYSTPLSKPYTSKVRFIRSENGGTTFSEPITVHKDRRLITHGFASTVVAPNGLIYVTWIDKRDQQVAKDSGGSFSGASQYYSVSKDGGRTFGPDYKIADHTCECCRSSLALNLKGNPVLLWRHVFERNIRDHAIAELSSDGSLGPIERASRDNWAIDACPHQGPAIAFGSDGRRHQTWFTGGAEGGALFYANQKHDGTLSTPIKLGTDQASNADVAVSGNQVEVVWKQFEGMQTRIKSMSSSDAGATWSLRDLASTDGASDQPRLAKNGDDIYLVWRTERARVTTLSLFRRAP